MNPRITTERISKDNVLTDAIVKSRSKVARFGMEQGIEFILEVLYSVDTELFDHVEGALESVTMRIGKEEYNVIDTMEKIRAVEDQFKSSK